MIDYSRGQLDHESVAYWSHVIQALDYLTLAGMSDDEETVDREGNKGVMVFSPAFRAQLYDELFDAVDQTPSRERHIFSHGRSGLPRTRSNQTINRPPPDNIPDIYLRVNRSSSHGSR